MLNINAIIISIAFISLIINSAIAEEIVFPKTEQEIVRALSLKRGLGKSVKIRPKACAKVQFDYNSYEIKKESYPLLDEFGKALKGGLDGINITIIGHTDDKGDGKYNMDLSLKRASAVKRYLVEKQGISSERLKIKGKGEEEPIAPNDNKEGSAKNRRVEFVR
ncbi:MAG: OmpA family protein [Desulfobacterales bacterium]|nr:OmpA family protein [Desulfobacterales bacterium]MBF0396256.1 OmpA family protein [Desulfobacterales bacterium]